MIIKKSNLGKLCMVYWDDARGEIHSTLDEVLKMGFYGMITVGWLMYEDEDKVVVATERVECEEMDGRMTGDFTLIPRNWIKKIVKLKEK
jgi:hypothetical protein